MTARQPRLMIVDDSHVMRMLFAALCQALALDRPLEASGAESALRTLRSTVPDVLFCDWQMADVDGIALVRRLRGLRLATMRELPIVMLTANDTPDFEDSARTAGASAVLVKPISVVSLNDCLVSLNPAWDAHPAH